VFVDEWVGTTLALVTVGIQFTIWDFFAAAVEVDVNLELF
jgi:hypothetical protein